MRVLIPVLDSVNALPAARYVIRESVKGERPEVELLHVRSPLTLTLGRFFGTDPLHATRELLEKARIRHRVRRIEARDRAQAIVAAAGFDTPDLIVLGAARHRSATRMSEDAVIQKLLDAAPAPMVVVAGKDVSPLERYGISAGLGVTLGLILIS
jgi:nucleotide-binding universal stress UspA family protein